MKPNNNTFKTTALYCRLSRDDGMEATATALLIKNFYYPNMPMNMDCIILFIM